MPKPRNQILLLKVVIMDNVNLHKVIGVKEAIEEDSAQLILLPPYSPDLSPIEDRWSKITSVPRKFAPRTKSQFRKVIRNAFRYRSKDHEYNCRASEAMRFIAMTRTMLNRRKIY